MRMLIIRAEQMRLIAEAKHYAEAHPISYETLRANALRELTTKLEEVRVIGYEGRRGNRPASEVVDVDLPTGFHVAFSFEEQAHGLARHISISVDTPGKLPSKEALTEIAALFGFTGRILKEADAVWIEEFRPGQGAVNILQMLKPVGRAQRIQRRS